MRPIRFVTGCAVLVLASACITKGDTNIGPAPSKGGGAGSGPTAGASGASSGVSGVSGAAGAAGAAGTSSGGGGLAGTSAVAGSAGAAGTAGGAGVSGGAGSGGGVAMGKCTTTPPAQLTTSTTTKSGLSVSTDGARYLLAWQAKAGADHQVHIAMNDGLGAPSTSTSIADVALTGLEGAYVDTVYTATSQRFVALWADSFGSEAFPHVQYIRADGSLDGDAATTKIGSFADFQGNARHHLAWNQNKILVSHYWCPGGGSGCPPLNPAAGQPDFVNQPYMLIDDPSRVVTSPGLVYGVDPQMFGFLRMQQTLPFVDAEANTKGFLILAFDGSIPALGQVSLAGKVVGLTRFDGLGGSNVNADSRLAWDGSQVVAFSYGNGSGATQGPGLRMERYTVNAVRTLEVKIALPEVRPASLLIQSAGVSALVTDGSQLMLLRRKQTGEEVLAPETVVTGDTIGNAFLFADTSGGDGAFLAFWMAKAAGLEQVFSSRIACAP